MNQEEFMRSIYAGLVVELFLLVAGFIFRKVRLALERIHPLARPIGLGTLALIFVFSNIFIQWNSIPYSLALFIVSTCIFGWIVFAEFEGFWRIGLLGADRTIAKGIDYRKSLNLCTDSLEFLGIGANKLLNEREAFRGAINRCRRDERAIRFLLCPPDHEKLIDIARQAGRPDKEYQEKVKDTLRELRDLKEKKAINIQVKFYSKLPLFRLMFVNDTFCLASHYILGEGEGSQLPQLHVWKKPPGQRDIESFYFPLKRYYEQMWEEARPWDFKSYL